MKGMRQLLLQIILYVLQCTLKHMHSLSPGSRDHGLHSHDEEEHEEGAEHVGLEHLIPHLGELQQTTHTHTHLTMCLMCICVCI